MKHIIDHEYYKKPFDYNSIFIFFLYLIIAILIIYYERKISEVNDRIIKFDHDLNIETDQAYYKREVLKK